MGDVILNMSTFTLIVPFFPLPICTTSATQLVLKAHKEAVNSLSGNGSTKLGTVATVVAAANSTALEASKEVEAAMQIAMRTALGAMMNRTPDGPMDDLTIMKVRKCAISPFFPFIINVSLEVQTEERMKRMR